MEQTRKPFFTILVTGSKRNGYIIGLQNGSDKNFELLNIAKLRKDFPERGNMNDKQYKTAVDAFLAKFVSSLEFFEPKLSYGYSNSGELSFADYTSARFCIRELNKLLGAE